MRQERGSYQMNVLTKNRILQKGDEFNSEGKWKPIPAADFGLQIMFTPYKEVRRPTEEPPKTLPISPDRKQSGASPAKTEPPSPAKAESEKSPVPTHSGTGERSYPAAKPLAATYGGDLHTKLAKKLEAEKLPTVVSKKAHKFTHDHTGAMIPKTTPTAGEVASLIAAVIAPPKTTPAGEIDIPYPDKSTPCIWIGRNGSFYAKALHLDVLEHTDEKDNVIRVRPVGTRGLARNAIIEFPASIIPQVVDWLLRHQPAKT